MRSIYKSRIAKLAKEGRGLRGTFTAKTMSEVITAQQARDAEVREALFGKKPEKSKKTDRQKAKARTDGNNRERLGRIPKQHPNR